MFVLFCLCVLFVVLALFFFCLFCLSCYARSFLLMYVLVRSSVCIVCVFGMFDVM